MKTSACIVLFFLQGCFGGWTNICLDGFNSENDCCKLDTVPDPAAPDVTVDEGMQTHEYQIIFDKGNFAAHLSTCLFQGLIDTKHHYQLLTLESRREHTCVMKWLDQEEKAFGPFYIGLLADTSDGMRNLFEWAHPVEAIGYQKALDSNYGEMKYTAWAPSAPRGAGDCVYSQVGETFAGNGLWYDVACTTAYTAICERFPIAVATTVAPPNGGY
jgi:hypothetical protein